MTRGQCDPYGGGWNGGPCGPAPCGGECVPGAGDCDSDGPDAPTCGYCGNEIAGEDTEEGFCDSACYRDALQDMHEERAYEAYRDSRYDD